MTPMRRRLLVAAVLLAAAGISVVLWLVALRTDNTGLEMWLLIGDGLLVGGLASAPTGVYLMRQGRGAGLANYARALRRWPGPGPCAGT